MALWGSCNPEGTAHSWPPRINEFNHQVGSLAPDPVIQKFESCQNWQLQIQPGLFGAGSCSMRQARLITIEKYYNLKQPQETLSTHSHTHWNWKPRTQNLWGVHTGYPDKRGSKIQQNLWPVPLYTWDSYCNSWAKQQIEFHCDFHCSFHCGLHCDFHCKCHFENHFVVHVHVRWAHRKASDLRKDLESAELSSPSIHYWNNGWQWVIASLTGSWLSAWRRPKALARVLPSEKKLIILWLYFSMVPWPRAHGRPRC